MARLDHWRCVSMPEVGTRFLEGDLDLPAPDEPLQHVVWRGVEIGGQEGVRVEFPGRVAHQQPADRHGRQAGVIPDGRSGGDLDPPAARAHGTLERCEMASVAVVPEPTLLPQSAVHAHIPVTLRRVAASVIGLAAWLFLLGIVTAPLWW